MKQIYTPNVNVPATPGWCLEYVDDACNAPNRTSRAIYAYNNEKAAGRTSMANPPKNIWLVGFLDFTSGIYQDYGHVFLFRVTGRGWEIHDSEVHSGSRGVYNSINELLEWFGIYDPKYTGWSTSVDGRTLAQDYIMEKTALNYLVPGTINRAATDEDRKKYLGQDPNQVILDLNKWAKKNGRDYNSTLGRANGKIKELTEDLTAVSSQNVKLVEENEELKEDLANQPPPVVVENNGDVTVVKVDTLSTASILQLLAQLWKKLTRQD